MTTFAATTNADAFSILRSQASASGVTLGTLSDVASVALTVANILGGGASSEALPAGNVTHGTFGSVTSDTGIYSFPAQVGIGQAGIAQASLVVSAAVTAAAGSGFGTQVASTITAAANSNTLAELWIAPAFTPGAFTSVAALGVTVRAFSVAAFTSPSDPVGFDCGIITGTGATNAFGIRVAPPTGASNNYLIAHTTAATFNVTAAGAMTAAGLLTIAGVTSSAALTVNAASQLGTAAGTDQTVIGGTGYGAGVASLRMNGLTTAATNNLVGTLTNSPVTGNPTFWMPISIAGVVKYIPCF